MTVSRVTLSVGTWPLTWRQLWSGLKARSMDIPTRVPLTSMSVRALTDVNRKRPRSPQSSSRQAAASVGLKNAFL